MTDQETATDARVNGTPPQRALLFILLTVTLYAAAIYLPFLGSGRTLTAHEIDVAETATNMLATGDWLVPQREGRPWVHKPPLVAWLAAPLLAAAGGFSEFAVRLPAALSAIALCVLVTVLAYRFLSLSAALLAGLVQATCVYMYMQGRLAESDMTFALLIAAAHAVLAWHWGHGRTNLPLASAAAFHALVGLAVLAKGPPAIVFVGMTVVLFCAVRGTARPLRAVLLTPAVVCFLVVGLGWYVVITLRLGGWAVGRWDYSYLQRFFGGYHLESKPFPYYFWTIPWLMLPWTIVLLLGARRLFRDARRTDAAFDHFLWVWFLGGLMFLTASAFKHQHYCIPILPPLSILCGKLLAEHAARLGKRAFALYAGVFGVCLIVFEIVGGVVMPMRDHRRATADFVRQTTAQVPLDAELYVAGLPQSAIYPYIAHAFIDANGWAEAVTATQNQSGKPVWVLTNRDFLETVGGRGVRFEEVADESAREHRPRGRTLVLGRLVAGASE